MRAIRVAAALCVVLLAAGAEAGAALKKSPSTDASLLREALATWPSANIKFAFIEKLLASAAAAGPGLLPRRTRTPTRLSPKPRRRSVVVASSASARWGVVAR